MNTYQQLIIVFLIDSKSELSILREAEKSSGFVNKMHYNVKAVLFEFLLTFGAGCSFVKLGEV